MKLRTLPENKTYDPLGKCIYCRTPEPASPLYTREHIVAYGLRGNLVFRRAVCKTCKDKTHEIEDFCLKETFKVPRIVAGWRSRHSPEPTSVRTGRPTPGMASEGVEWIDTPVEDAPLAYGSLNFARPGILFGRAPHEGFRVRPGRPLTHKPYPEEWRKAGTTIIATVKPALWCRMIAKIAHAAAVAELGFDAFAPYLLPIILGDDRNIGHLVGQARRSLVKVPSSPYHIQLFIEAGYVIARVHIFPDLGFNAMEAVVGTPLSAFDVRALHAPKQVLRACPVKLPFI